MPHQQVFFEQEAGDRRVVVLKSYDGKFAREAFEHMDPGALAFLSTTLDLPDDAPSSPDPDYLDFLWQSIEDGAREDWNTFSYFVVLVGTEPRYVSSEWPSAEAYAKIQMQ